MDTVVLLHGLWFNGTDMTLLRRRLARAGYHPVQFSYRTVRVPPPENAFMLNTFLRGVPGERVHFLAHSLGGIVLRHFFFEFPDQRPGRVVTLGTPHMASAAARTLSRARPGRAILGESVHRGLLGGLPPWPADRDLGSIAGDLPLGLGLAIPGIPRPNDGTVAVAETRFPGMRDHATLPVSHLGMLVSRRVFHEALHFFRNGRFNRSDMNAAI